LSGLKRKVKRTNRPNQATTSFWTQKN